MRRGNHETPGAEVEPGFFSVLVLESIASADRPDVMPLHPLEPAGADQRPPAGAGPLADRLEFARRRAWSRGSASIASGSTCSAGASSRRPRTWAVRAPRRRTPNCSNGWLADSWPRAAQLKPLVKLLVTSAVYRQASVADAATVRGGRPAVRAVDPANRLLWRMPLRRLEAEIVRDAILAASGQLDLRSAARRCPWKCSPTAWS